MADEVGERWEDRTGGVDESAVRTLNRSWWVKTDDPKKGVPAAIAAVIAKDPTAALYSRHPDWPWAVCRGPQAKPNGSQTAWLVTATYSTAPFRAMGDGGAGISGLGNPTTDGGGATAPTVDQSNQKPADQRPPTVSVGRKEVTKPFQTDVVTGLPHVNTVGDPFIPPVEVFRSHDLITIKFLRKPKDLKWPTRIQYRDSVNTNSPVIFGKTYKPYTLRVVDYSLETQWDTGDAGLELFFALTVVLEEDPDSWKVSTLNTGRRKRVTGASETDPTAIVVIRDKNGDPVPDPVPLNEDGSLAAVGGPYWYVTHDGYIPRDFSAGLLK